MDTAIASMGCSGLSFWHISVSASSACAGITSGRVLTQFDNFATAFAVYRPFDLPWRVYVWLFLDFDI